ncbi:GNAT family N-acetyltransferase [Streptococcus dentapri]|uniref:GNAT family N-acetyltransferase n=1 Tax=Streptococcus dentapri TaxID=573564 RepID=A0ABV8D046_9STRE
MTLVLKKIGVDQVEFLREISIETFRESFAHDNTEEQMQDYFDQAFNLSVLTQELASPESSYILAEINGKPAGFLKTNTGSAQTEKELENAFEIQRIYVLQAYQGLGIGKALFEFALSEARKSGADWVWLGVWERNFKAQHFYAKYGFMKFGQHSFQVSPDKVDTDWLLRKKLKND